LGHKCVNSAFSHKAVSEISQTVCSILYLRASSESFLQFTDVLFNFAVWFLCLEQKFVVKLLDDVSPSSSSVNEFERRQSGFSTLVVNSGQKIHLLS